MTPYDPDPLTIPGDDPPLRDRAFVTIVGVTYVGLVGWPVVVITLAVAAAAALLWWGEDRARRALRAAREALG